MRLITDGGEDREFKPEDITTKDDLKAFKDELLDVLGGDSDDEPEDDDEHGWPFDFEPDELDQTVEAKTKAMMDHISDPEACDDPSCQNIREKFGFGEDVADPGDSQSQGGADEEAEVEEEDDDEPDEEDEEDEPERGMFGARLE